MNNVIYFSHRFKDPEFDPEKILAKSSAASGLCAWVINIHNFYNVFLVVEPKKRALVDAQNELRAAQEKLNYLNSKILVRIRILCFFGMFNLKNISMQEIEDRLKEIQTEFRDAISDKTRLEIEAEKTELTINLAHRLVNGLGSEAIRWHQSVEKYISFVILFILSLPNFHFVKNAHCVRCLFTKSIFSFHFLLLILLAFFPF